MQAQLAAIADAARRGDFTAASRLADQAIAAGLVHPLPFHVRAIARERAGDAENALADYTRAHELSPGDPGVLNTLGLCLTRLRRFEPAAEAFAKALAIAPNQAQTHYNLGLMHKDAGHMPAAAASFEAAIALSPTHVEALGQLALLAAQRGDWPTTRQWAERALGADTKAANALRALVQADLGEGRPREAEIRLRDWLTQPNLTPTVRHEILGLLGDALDRQDRIDDAFAAYQKSNTVLRESSAPLYDGRRGATVPQTLDWLSAAFHALPAFGSAPPATAPSPVHGHIFLVGFMRSGTTLLEQSLANHPDVVTLEEYEALADSTQAFLSSPDRVQALATLDGATADKFRALYWQRVREAGVAPDGKVLLDKHPFNAIKLPLIAKLFPDAKIIFAIRDPRDVIFSCYRHRLRLAPLTYELLDLQTATGLYNRVMHLAERYRATLNVPVIDHRHEALVADFEGTMRALCDRLDLSWTDAFRDIGARVRQGLTISQSAPQIRVGLNDRGVAQWRRYSTHLAPILPALEPWVRRFGYDAS